uniref:Uncharacterized protein n=1 Tax=Populus trichocarpa TaxID=3694 RepID=B9I594_POPTR|eukprot:XP_002318401.1 UPF0481 protein At3g47200 [Populus trichocarpa]
MGGNGSASTSIDIEGLLKELVPGSMQTTLREEMCIYRVPVNIRKVNEDAYTPQLICIGPIHQKNENQDMKELKRRYFKQFFNRLPVLEWGTALRELVSTIKECEDEIRNCYEDATFEHCKDQIVFLKMILLDAVFIFELFLKTREHKLDNDKSQAKYMNDYIIGKPCVGAAIKRDLILLENQLPFEILGDLYKKATPYIQTCCSSLPKTDPSKTSQPKTHGSCPPETFLKLACDYFEKYKKNKTDPRKILHFTDLIRYFLLPVRELERGSPIENLYRATLLHQAGMKFKSRPEDNLLYIRTCNKVPTVEDGGEVEGDVEGGGGGGGDVEEEDYSIKKGELYVPTLEIDDHTERLFRNLMALEQCHYPNKAFICEYVKFLDFLVDTKEDSDLLIRSKVIINRLGESDDVAKLINKLCQEIVEVHSCYYHHAKALEAYYESCYNNSKAFLRRQYFSNVWIGTGTIVGLIVLFITLGNFVRSFF